MKHTPERADNGGAARGTPAVPHAEAPELRRHDGCAARGAPVSGPTCVISRFTPSRCANAQLSRSPSSHCVRSAGSVMRNSVVHILSSSTPVSAQARFVASTSMDFQL